MRSKSPNASKPERLRRDQKPEFGTAGIVIGLLVGLALGFIAELVAGGGMIVMQAGGAAGALVGVAVEGVRFWLQKRR